MLSKRRRAYSHGASLHFLLATHLAIIVGNDRVPNAHILELTPDTALAPDTIEQTSGLSREAPTCMSLRLITVLNP
jgi:hypothetical protein